VQFHRFCLPICVSVLCQLALGCGRRDGTPGDPRLVGPNRVALNEISLQVARVTQDRGSCWTIPDEITARPNVTGVVLSLPDRSATTRTVVVYVGEGGDIKLLIDRKLGREGYASYVAFDEDRGHIIDHRTEPAT